MNLALFDLDNTLLTSDSDFEWSQFLIEKKVLDRKEYESRNLEFYEQYKSGTLDINQNPLLATLFCIFVDLILLLT